MGRKDNQYISELTESIAFIQSVQQQAPPGNGIVEDLLAKSLGDLKERLVEAAAQRFGKQKTVLPGGKRVRDPEALKKGGGES